MDYPDVTLYSLTTCGYCTAIKKMLTALEIPHQFKDADLFEGTEREELLKELRTINPKCSFPTTRIGDRTVIGFKVQEIKEAIGIRTEVDDLHDLLKKTNEPKGYFFNRDRERTFDLIRALMTNN
ncbi:MAG: glutaredoxin family protein, partial [Desulfocapsaceae bacterium]